MKTHTTQPDASEEITGTVYLKLTQFDDLCNTRGWSNDLRRARAIGVEHTTIRRLRKGLGNPGGKFIGLAMAALEVPFDAIFGRKAA